MTYLKLPVYNNHPNRFSNAGRMKVGVILILFSEEPERKEFIMVFSSRLCQKTNMVIETGKVSADDCRRNACADPLLLHKYAAG
jgi:hypothetical protein